MSLVKFVFYNDYQLQKNNEDIAQSLYDIAKSNSVNNNELQDLKYLLIYLSLSLNLNSKFNESFFLTAQLYQIMKNYEKAEIFYNNVHKDHHLFLESKKKLHCIIYAMNLIKTLTVENHQKDLGKNYKYKEYCN